MRVIKRSTPRANKEHICDYCGCKIEKCETYERTTIVNDGELYDWKNHIECSQAAVKLGMFDVCDDGLTGEGFREYIDEWLYNYYYPNDVPVNIVKMSYIGKVFFIIYDLKMKMIIRKSP